MVKDVIYVDDIREEMVDVYRNGYEKAETTHFTSINVGYRWLRMDVTAFFGIGNHGKSKFYTQLAILRAKYNNEKFGIFSPEKYPAVRFYHDIIHTITGIYPNSKYLGETEYFTALEWVKDHFFYIYPETESPTPGYINDRFELLIKDHKIDGVCIDPFNQLTHDWETSGRDDRYISGFLQTAKRFAQVHDIYYHIIGHPKGTIGIEKEGDFMGNLRCPNVFDLAGGPMWNNHCDNIIIIHKPYNITNTQSTEVIIRAAKIKDHWVVGMPGDYFLNFDRHKNRYFDKDGSPFDESYGKVQSVMFNEPNDSDPF